MINRKLFLSLSTVALFATACDADKVTEANNNPNDPTDAPSTALFTNAARLAAARWLDGVNGTRYGFLPQHMAQVQYPDDDQYLAARLGASATANIVVVGAIVTPQMRAESPRKDFSTFTPAEEIADAIAYLCSDAAASMNGQRVTLRGAV